jgi:arylsulfatase A-like enzyme
LENLNVHAEDVFSRFYSHRRLTREWASLPPGKTEALHDLYDGELRWLDMQLEELLPWLESALGPENVIIVVSDHGEELGEEGRVGHESTLSQRILHVPLFVGGDRCTFRKINEVVTTRRLFDFILACASGKIPEPEVLSQMDEFATIAERYPSPRENAPNNPLSHCPRVAYIEGSFKVVGPSICTTSVYNIEQSDFQDSDPLTEAAAATPLLEFVDTYWDAYRDKRGEKSTSRRPSKEELEKLRSLGYID